MPVCHCHRKIPRESPRCWQESSWWGNSLQSLYQQGTSGDGKRPAVPTMPRRALVALWDRTNSIPTSTPGGMLLSSHSGLGGVGEQTALLPTKPTSVVEGGEADESRLCKDLWDPKYHLGIRYSHYYSYTQGSYQLKAAIHQGTVPFTPALKMPTEEEAFNCLCFSLPHYHWGKYHLTQWNQANTG